MPTERLRAEVNLLDPFLNKTMRIGVGSSTELQEASLSYSRAMVAANIATDIREHIVFWEDRPLESLLEATLKTSIEEALVPSLLLEKVQLQSEENLETLNCFLNQAGNVARTSERLHLHRTTVYYRLKQFEKETQLSLDDGNTRLLLHLWLKIRRELVAQWVN